MKTIRIFCLFFAVLLLLSANTVLMVENEPLTLSVSVDRNGERTPISPYIYGINGVEPSVTQRSARQGGNRLTGYNWHNNYSNAGSDWQHYSDNLLANNLRVADMFKPAAVITDFAQKAAEAGAYAVVTLPMAGYVARDNGKTVTEEQTAPSERWARVEDRKPGGDFTLTPDPDADTVYTDELLYYLISELGDASSSTGIQGYCLDNEPGLWSSTHPRIHPHPVTVAELLQKTVSLASTVKDADPRAEVFGPVLYGFNAYRTLQDAEDWEETYQADYDWFLDCYLDQMREAETEQGRRLLDVLDLHYYSEAQNQAGQRVSFGNQTDSDSVETRVQSTRSLWDPTYTENSWIGQWFSQYLPLLPRVKTSIDQYYPGTKLSFTEYSFGAEDHISGAVAIADALGIFAENEVYLATLWPLTDDISYAASAINLYTGAGFAFGRSLLPVTGGKTENGSVYASEDAAGNLHLMLINKDITRPLQCNVQIGGDYYVSRINTLDSNSSDIHELAEDSASFSNGTLTTTVQPLSVSHLLLAEGKAPQPSPSPAPPSPSLAEETPQTDEQSDGWPWSDSSYIMVGVGLLFLVAMLVVKPGRKNRS